MSLLLSPPLSSLLPSKEVNLNNTLNTIKTTSALSYRQLCEIQKRGIDLVWNNSDLTPQEILDGLGSDASKIFQYHGALTDYIVSLASIENIQPDIKLPTNAFELNPDGTVTVLDTPYVPS